MTDKEKILAEIERLKEDISIGLCAYDAGEENGKSEICDKILSFINSLPEESVALSWEDMQFIDGLLYSERLKLNKDDFSTKKYYSEAAERFNKEWSKK